MGKLQDFLMEAQIGTTQTEVQIAPFPYPFIVKSITEAENKAIRKTCQKVEFDKKTRQKRIDTDLLLAVQEINGFTDDVNDLRDEAKN